MDASFYSKLEMVGLAVHVILKANHEDKKFLFNGQEILVKRGQFITGRKALAKEFKMPESTIWGKLLILKNLDFLDITSNNKFSIITIVKYNQYQDKSCKSDSTSDNQPTTSRQPADTNNIIAKNEKNEKKKNKEQSPAGSSVLPTEKKKTIVDLYCLAYELHFKVKPFLREDGKIDMPKGEVMSLQRVLRRFGEEKARGFFTLNTDGTIPIFTDQRIMADSWCIQKNFSPNSLEKKLIDIKNKRNLEAVNGN